MTGEWEGGKGSCYRKLNNQTRFYQNWDLIFGEKDNEPTISKSKGEKTSAMDEREAHRASGHSS